MCPDSKKLQRIPLNPIHYEQVAADVKLPRIPVLSTQSMILGLRRKFDTI